MPDSAAPRSTETRPCAPSSRNTAANQADTRTLSGLNAEIAHLRTALEAIAERVRGHEERLRRLEGRRAVRSS